MANVSQVVQWADVIKQSNFLTDAGHSFCWSIIKGLGSLLNACEDLVAQVYTFIDFTQWTTFQKLFNNTDAKWILIGLFTVAMLGIAWYFTFNYGDKKAKFLKNICSFLLILFVLPMLMTTLNQLTVGTQQYIMGRAGGEATSTNRIINNGVVDLKYIDKNGFGNYSVDGSTVTGKGLSNNSFSQDSSNILQIDVNEVITEDSNVKNEDYLLNIVKTDDSGNLQLNKIEKGKLFGLVDFTNYNYRYHVNYGFIMITLLASVIAYFLMAFKVIKIIYELAISPIIAIVTGASDMVNGEKMKEAVKNIFYSYATLMLIPLLMQIYFTAQNFITNQLALPTFIKTVLLVVCAFCLCDGPNLIQRIFGIDVGIKSGFHTAASMFMAARTIGSGAKDLSKAAAGLVGAGTGVAEALSSRVNESRTQNSNNGENITSSGSDINQPMSNNSSDVQQNNSSSPNNQNVNSSVQNSADTGSSINAGDSIIPPPEASPSTDSSSSTIDAGNSAVPPIEASPAAESGVSPISAGDSITPPADPLSTSTDTGSSPNSAANQIELPPINSVGKGNDESNPIYSSADKNAVKRDVTNGTAVGDSMLHKNDKFRQSENILNNGRVSNFRKGRAIGHRIGMVGKKSEKNNKE